MSRRSLRIKLITGSVIHLRLNQLWAFTIIPNIVIVLIVTTSSTFQPNKYRNKYRAKELTSDIFYSSLFEVFLICEDFIEIPANWFKNKEYSKPTGQLLIFHQQLFCLVLSLLRSRDQAQASTAEWHRGQLSNASRFHYR